MSVVKVDFLKGLPFPPRPTRVRVYNDLFIHVLKQMQAQMQELITAQEERVAAQRAQIEHMDSLSARLGQRRRPPA